MMTNYIFINLREMQKITIELNEENNLACTPISPYLTNDTLVIQEDFLPKEFNDIFAKWQKQNVVNDLGPQYAVASICVKKRSNIYGRYAEGHGDEKAETKRN